jgi:hypothetical protein
MASLLKFSFRLLIDLKPLAQYREARWNVRASETYSQAVIGHGTEFGSIDARGEEQNARFLDEPARKFLYALRALVADEADAAAVRLAPIEQVPVLGKKCTENGQVFAHHFSIPFENLLARLECDACEHLGRR